MGAALSNYSHLDNKRVRTPRAPGWCTGVVLNSDSTTGFWWGSYEKVQRTARGSEVRAQHVQEGVRDGLQQVLDVPRVGGVDEVPEVHG